MILKDNSIDNSQIIQSFIMSYINLPNREDLEGRTLEIFDETVDRWGYIPNISRAYLLAPEIMEAEDTWTRGVMYNGFLPRKLKEAIATTVSSTNDCNYCASSHAHAYTIAGGSFSASFTSLPQLTM